MDKFGSNDYAQECIIGRREGTFEGTPDEDNLCGTTDEDLEEWHGHQEWLKERKETHEKAVEWEKDHGAEAKKEGPKTKTELESLIKEAMLEADDAKTNMEAAEEAFDKASEVSEKKEERLQFLVGWRIHLSEFKTSDYKKPKSKKAKVARGGGEPGKPGGGPAILVKEDALSTQPKKKEDGDDTKPAAV